MDGCLLTLSLNDLSDRWGGGGGKKGLEKRRKEWRKKRRQTSHGCAGLGLVNLTQARVIKEKGASAEKTPP